jgi:plastocyanin
MKKVLLLCAAVLALVGASSATSEPTATANVNITATGFTPSNVAIRAGDTVVWKNTDTAEHQVVSSTGAFPASPVLKSNETYSYRFGTPSAYSYHDGRKPASEGTVVVRGSGNTVNIAVTRVQLVYRNPVRVFGGVGNGRAGETVTVTITRYGGAQVVKTLTTDADGTYTFEDRPGIRSEYKASWRNGQSSQAPFVNVRPLVIFNVISARNNLFFVRVRAQRSYAGKVVRIQRQNAQGVWVTTKRVRLNAKGQANFRGNFARGTTRARAWVNSSPGYIPGFSVTKTVRR